MDVEQPNVVVKDWNPWAKPFGIKSEKLLIEDSSTAKCCR